MPRPSATKTLILMVAGCVNAKPSAAPINGAVQGLATTAASTPVKKEPLSPDFCVRLCPAPIHRAQKTDPPGRQSIEAIAAEIPSQWLGRRHEPAAARQQRAKSTVLCPRYKPSRATPAAPGRPWPDS